MTVLPWQEELWRNVTSHPLPSALLLAGREGIGKLAFGRALAQRILCERSSACGECPSCRWLARQGAGEESAHPDFLLVEPREEGLEKKRSRDIKVDQIRQLTARAALASTRTKVFVLHPAEAMNANAQNALLKVLEEPLGETLFILISHRPQHLLPTVLSRCRRLTLPEPSCDTALIWLKGQGLDGAETALAAAGGAPLAALRLNMEGRKLFMAALSRPLNALTLAQAWQKFDAVEVVHWLQQWAFDLALGHHRKKPRYNVEYEPELRALVGKIGLRAIFSLHRELIAARAAAEHSLNPALFMEQLSLSYWRLTQNG